MRLVFEDRYYQEHELAQCKDLEEGFKEINKFLDEHNFKAYYYRISHTEASETPSYYWIDVGSHSEFFKLYEDEVCD